MTHLIPIRFLPWLAGGLLSATAALPAAGQNSVHPAPIVRRAPSTPAHQEPQQRPAMQPAQHQPPAAGAARRDNAPAQIKGEHLAGWLDHHSNLTPQQQQQALEQEPGFRSLPSQTQQRMRERLSQLDNMPPAQREKIIQRTEQMERLSPDQRNQVRGAMQQLTNLPPDRRHYVARTFRNLRDMTPEQRQAYMNSPEYRSQFSDQERNTLSGLISISPLLPPHE